MKFIAAALFSAAVVSADAIYSVTDFNAGCIPHSVECSYSFSVVHVNNGEFVPVNCTASAVSDNTLPAVTGTCEESSRTFVIARNSTGLTLTVTQPVSVVSYESGSHFIPKDEITTKSDQVATLEIYDGPTAFTLFD
ncbi:glycoprotein [Grosmannia clavigera kw1407]|uniref:Glycoprotein n=1 Tax=Grosmannia clavigera (strain kw1407 / UAMH 11150) TaxID=655863 RepID=F0XNK8_GROCL|nr:glycoprotein [Grosmannia clavigera kw1407]EFX00405.1 glycoprotein [Grosmannia clavigera kw1407]